MYTSFKALEEAYAGEKVSKEEYRKYFGRILGKTFPGYPDFSTQYFNRLIPSARKGNKTSRQKFAIVVSECNEHGEIEKLEKAVVCNKLADARSFMNAISEVFDSNWINTDEFMVPLVEGQHQKYTLVPVEGHDSE